MAENTIIRESFGNNPAVLVLRLNKPELHNALGWEDLQRFQELLVDIGQDTCARVLVITGTGEKTFCSGAQLSGENPSFLDGNPFQALVDQVDEFPLPTVCALNGSAYGGGVELALACDFRIGSPGQVLFVPPARIGLCYPYEGIERFVSRLGMSATKRLLLANETFCAAESNELGFYDYLVEPESFFTFVGDFCLKIADFAPLALQSMKATINELGRGRGPTNELKMNERRCIRC